MFKSRLWFIMTLKSFIRKLINIIKFLFFNLILKIYIICRLLFFFYLFLNKLFTNKIIFNFIKHTLTKLKLFFNEVKNKFTLLGIIKLLKNAIGNNKKLKHFILKMNIDNFTIYKKNYTRSTH